MKRHSIIKLLIFIIVISTLSINTVFAIEVAITVDDLPANGNLPPHVSRMDVAKKMLFIINDAI